MDWYYVAANQRVGPVTQADFDALVRSGTVTADTLVWNEGMKDWQRFADVAKPDPALAAPVALNPTNPAVAGVVCSECGRTFSSDEVIRYGTVAVCAQCKPTFVQKLKEGVVAHAALEYAGFWRRFAAVLVDGIILWIVNSGVAMLVLASMGQLPSPEQDPRAFLTMQGILVFIQMAIGISYEVGFIGKYGATPGKMACRIKVVTPDGGPVTYGRALGRYFAKLLSGFILLIGYIMAAFDPEKRALHDRICNTRVIKAR